jgi:hypothetical protein
MFLKISIVDWLEQFQLPCIYKIVMGHDCPGCGMQRAVILLLRGNFIESLKMYPPLIPIIIMLVFMISHLIFKFKHGAKILVGIFIFNVIIILSNYFYKLLI